ncbi:2OG-Fe(II) oxygenase [Tenacibaculum sp. MEBiC06402]|uniref:2OG-Fe(II) oxygenase n=1 Tax=unclassified Tenacibaculum TaxID=2635139 RepID=UPI003B9B5EA0
MKKIIDIFPDKNYFCKLIKGAFSDDFCDSLIEKSRNSFVKSNTHYPISYRNNERQVIDDYEFSDYLFSRIKDFIPKDIAVKAISDKEIGSWKLKKLNSKFRICRYLSNQYFHKHLDGVYYLSSHEQSKLTFMIYLNGSEEFEGGRTLFFNSKQSDEIIASYKPVKGDLIIFDHNIWHSGERIESGEKYVLRSDIIYSKTEDGINNEVPFEEGHLGYIWQAVNFSNKLITSGRDRFLKTWGLDGIKISEVKAHSNSVTTLMRFDEKTLISGSRDYLVKLWRINEQFAYECFLTLDDGKSTVLSLCKMNSKEFICADASGELRIYNLNGNLIKRIKAHEDWIWSVIKVSKNVIVTVSEDGTMVFRDFNNNEILMFWKGMNIPINSIAFDGFNSVYIGLHDGTIVKFMFDIETKDLTKDYIKSCHKGIVRKLVYEKGKLYSVGEDNVLNVWDADSFENLYRYNHKNFVQDVALFPDCFVSVSYDGTIVKHEKS